MAKGSAKKPKESKCRGSGAPLEGREWVRIGGSKWLREVAEKKGKFIAKEYAEKWGAEFDTDRAAREAEKEKAPLLAALAEAPRAEANIPDAEVEMDEEPQGTYDSPVASSQPDEE